jgi:hypothetical protein
LDRIEEALSVPEKDATREGSGQEKSGGIKRKRALIYSGAVVVLALILLRLALLWNQHSLALDAIAVLPFASANLDPDTEYLADGLTESIISKLTQLPSLKKVIARSSVFRYKGRQIDPRVVGEELGVNTVLVSEISRRGDDLTIRVETHEGPG